MGNNDLARAVIGPVCSTDNVWRGTDYNRCLSDDLNTIENDISVLKARTIKSINSNPISALGSSNGQLASFTGTINLSLESGSTYFLVIEYVSATGLVDKSVYVVYYDSTSSLINTYNIVSTKTGSDSLVLSQSESAITFSINYYTSNTTITSANLKFI